MANPTPYVFTYRLGEEIRPITKRGLSTAWRRARRRGLVPRDLRFHDLRHDYGTKLLARTRDLKLVQKAMGHSNITTTARYAHVFDEDLLKAMNEHGEELRRLREAASLSVVA
jgi:integrase